MNPHYNMNYTLEEVEEFLSAIKSCIVRDRFQISLNERRKENLDFINEYNIRPAKQKAILLQIESDDFCHSVKNKKAGYEHEDLYVFAPVVSLYNADDVEEQVEMYVKFNIIGDSEDGRTVVISFHKLNRPIEYRFK